ncbi:MAG TPA: phosphotransferase [Dictyobacter sp.]|jgi:Ser/Thr protein kinase RdoA (MazF antagonist)|nr:phosphotransferase [Dictyobacter sp.]
MSDFESEHDAGQQVSEEVHDLNRIMQAFGISQWENLGPTEASHANSLSVLVDVSGQHYVLRERPEGLIGEDINFRYDFQGHLLKAGIPLPAFYLTPQGDAAVQMGEDFFELQQQIGGEMFSTSSHRNLDWVESAGSMLGRIHAASRQYTGTIHRWPPEAHLGSVVQSYLQLARSRAEQSSIQAIASALSEWADQWDAVLPSTMMAIGAKHTLPELHIHGDYHALNLRFGPFGVSVVTGLEASRWEKRIFEIAYGLFYFSALAWLPGSTATPPLVKRGLEPERASRFLQGYAEFCPPVQDEASSLVDALMLIAPVVSINGPLEDLFYASDAELDATLIDDVLERLSWAISLPGWLQRVRRSLPEMWG